MDFLIALLRSGAGSGSLPGRGGFNVPWVGAQQQYDASKHDFAFRAAMQAAAGQHAQQSHQFLSSMAAGLQRAGGQQFTPEMQAALAAGGKHIGQITSQFSQVSANTRILADMFSGGISPLNTMGALAFNRGSMVDPITGQLKLSVEGMTGMNAGFHRALSGNGALDRAVNMQGFHGSDLLPVTSWLASRGALGDPLLARKIAANPTVRDALADGMSRNSDFISGGLGDIERVLGADMTTHEGQQSVAGEAGGRLGKRVSDTLGVLKSMQALFDPKLVDGIDSLVQNMESFTGRYFSQVGSKDLTHLVYQSTQSLKDLGYNAQQIHGMQSFVGTFVDQHGMRQGMTPNLFATINTRFAGLNNAQMFSGSAYGRMNQEEAYTKITQDEVGYVASDEMRGLASIMGAADIYGPDGFTADTHGTRAEKIIRNLRAGAPTGDAAFDAASPMEKQAIIAHGMKDAGALEQMQRMGQSQYLTEANAAKYHLQTNLQRSQQEEFKNTLSYDAAAMATSGLASSLGADGGRIQGMLADAMGDEFLGFSAAELDDPNGRPAEVMAQRMLNTLAAAALNNDQGAAAALAAAGSTPAEQQAYFLRDARKYFANLQSEGEEELGNYSLRFGYDAERVGAESLGRHRVKSFVEQITAGTSNHSVVDSAARLSEYLLDNGVPDKDWAGAINHALSSGLSDQDQQKLQAAWDSIQRIKEEELAYVRPEDQSDEEYNRIQQQRQDELDRHTEMIQEQLKEALERSPDDPATPGEVKADGSSAQSGGTNISITGLTINLGDEVAIAISNKVSAKASSTHSQGKA